VDLCWSSTWSRLAAKSQSFLASVSLLGRLSGVRRRLGGLVVLGYSWGYGGISRI